MSKLTKEKFVRVAGDVISNEAGGKLSILSKNEFDPVVEVLTDAFQKDPVLLWMAAESKDKKDELKQHITIGMSWAIRPILVRGKGVVIGVKDGGGEDTAQGDQIVGAVSLSSSDQYDSILDILTSLFALGKPLTMKSEFKKEFGPMSEKRMKLLFILSKKRVEIMRTEKLPNYIYIRQIGVMMEHQGKGLGGKLLRTIIRIAELLGNTALYLETESEENESLYIHFGFKTVEKLELSVPGDTSKDAVQTMWLMVRPPG
mmetsp:Transcript_27810/g.55690  ORF Transcript_27810/g.55690 Transcript_27810/m.55690 type:complete len:259 (+) Transcript_27810:72-848(+)|eukprot:CAMPEP_0194324932 /NCGR_PEP_ID=MMETSP0171-20130528/28942_1 /TAXON_ID=218684 /ORGANISM="Corethron pennatum, Strain L29A3" /LENGTH=258 /DNA_ID=CAMNT_0039083927 /DNA_START=51 /DNA_END=827 /DNA_ORIENTATION=+